MKKSNETPTTGWKSRLKMAVAGLALAGALAGGVSAAADHDAPNEDTTETAWAGHFRTAGWGVSWR